MDAQALGRYLRETREAKELTLDEVERALRIRRRILESFESGEFNIPEFAAIQIRGFMRNYARHLGLEEDRIVAYYEAALLESANPKGLSGRKKGQAKRGDKRESQSLTPVAPRTVTDTPPSLPAVVIAPPTAETRRKGPGIITVLLRLLVAAAAVAVIAYVVIQLMQPEGTVPPVADDNILGDLPPSPTATAPLPTGELLLLPTTPPNLQPDFTGQGVLVTLNLTQRTWLKISADGSDQYEGIARPGTHLEYPAGSNVTVIASNAAALDAVFNGQQQQSFGGRGQLVTVIFSESGVQINSGPGYAPTPEQSATPLPTPTDAAGALVAQLTPTAAPGAELTPTETLVAQVATSDTLVPVDIPVVTAVPSETPVPPSSTPIPSETTVPSATPVPTDAPTSTTVPSNTPVPTDTPIPTNTLTPSPTFTLTPSATFTLTPSNTPIPTSTPIPTNTPSPTATSILPPRGFPADATPTKVGK